MRYLLLFVPVLALGQNDSDSVATKPQGDTLITRNADTLSISVDTNIRIKGMEYFTLPYDRPMTYPALIQKYPFLRDPRIFERNFHRPPPQYLSKDSIP